MSTFFTEVDGVVFCENELEGNFIAEIREVGSTQNTTLADVKKQMAVKARYLGGDAIINFSYVQKADRGLHLLKWDKERINCSGKVIRLLNHPGTTPKAPLSTETKVCPACAEVVKSAAIKCRFCGEDI
jgi:hypothetical protein